MALLHSTTLRSAGFVHAFTTREDGDFAILRNPDLLFASQERLARGVGYLPERLHQARQVHGARLVVADGRPRALLEVEADALVADPETGHAVAVRVADCVPVLVADRASGRVAAVHAGWRGVEARILGVAIDHLARAAGADGIEGGARFVAAIGPCIGACCFEVGAEVAQRIAAVSEHGVVRRREGDKAFVDLRMAARVQLRALGLDDAAIDDVGGCTRCEVDRERDPEGSEPGPRYHSYRRDGDASGRLIGVIVAGVRAEARPGRAEPPR